jgi:hypothetical protein
MTHAHRRGAAGAPRRLLMLAIPTVVRLAGRGVEAPESPPDGGELVVNNQLDGVWLSE